MSCWVQRKCFHFLRLRAILTLAHDRGLIRFVREDASSSLISVRNTELKSIVIEFAIDCVIVVFGPVKLQK
jgi:hypothetical protein